MALVSRYLALLYDGMTSLLSLTCAILAVVCVRHKKVITVAGVATHGVVTLMHTVIGWYAFIDIFKAR